MDKKYLTERDICTKYITPAIKAAGWDIHSQVREEVIKIRNQSFYIVNTIRKCKSLQRHAKCKCKSLQIPYICKHKRLHLLKIFFINYE